MVVILDRALIFPHILPRHASNLICLRDKRIPLDSLGSILFCPSIILQIEFGDGPEEIRLRQIRLRGDGPVEILY